MKVTVLGLPVVACLMLSPSWAQDAGTLPAEAGTVPSSSHRPKVVLVLSGGGARGSAHVGVLKVLEEYHVPVDMIVGTSMGSIVGGLYAAGWSSGDLESKLLDIDWGSVFVDKLPRTEKSYRRKEEEDRFLIPIKMRFKHWKPYLPPSVIGGQNLELLFQGLAIEATGESDFDRFPIPYRAVASDLANGRAVVIREGSLSTAMRASMSIPGIFPPVELDGKALADGGMAANFPIRIARALGADVVIGVDITTPLKKKEQLGNLLTRIDQVTGLLTNANKEADMAVVEPQDVILVPDLSDISFSDFAKAKETIVRGEVAAREAEARLRALAVPDAEWETYVARHHRRTEASLVVDKVVIENTGPLSDAIVDRRIDVPIGRPLAEDDLAKQITKLYGMDVFGPIHHDLTRTDDQGVLTLQVPPKPYGRNSLQFGFFLASDFEGDLNFDLTLSHLFLPINRKGGEWRNIVQLGTNTVLGTEYYQPLDSSLAWVFDTRFQFRRDLLNFFTPEGDAVTEYTFDTIRGGAGFGRIFGKWGELLVGAFRTAGSGHPRIGLPVFPGVNSDDGGFSVQFFVRDFDSITWPRAGWRVEAAYRRSLTAMGAQASGDFARAEIGKAISVGKNVVNLSAEASDVASGLTLIDNVAVLGGFLRLSGLHTNQLLGAKGGLARAMYYRELTTFNLGSLTQRMYVGFSCETGNVYASGDPVTVKSLRLAGSVFVGADTVLGPAYFGYGYEQSGQQSAYLIIGQRF
jgi:NTE family protein